MEVNRLKIIRDEQGGLSQAGLAELLCIPLHKIRDAELGKTKISTEIASAVEEKLDYCFRWVLTGEGEKRKEKIPCATGVSEPQATYVKSPAIDPIEEAFLNDWRSLTEVGKMRIWTLLKEEKQRELEEHEKKPLVSNESHG